MATNRKQLRQLEWFWYGTWGRKLNREEAKQLASDLESTSSEFGLDAIECHSDLESVVAHAKGEHASTGSMAGPACFAGSLFHLGRLDVDLSDPSLVDLRVKGEAIFGFTNEIDARIACARFALDQVEDAERAALEGTPSGNVQGHIQVSDSAGSIISSIGQPGPNYWEISESEFLPGNSGTVSRTLYPMLITDRDATPAFSADLDIPRITSDAFGEAVAQLWPDAETLESPGTDALWWSIEESVPDGGTHRLSIRAYKTRIPTSNLLGSDQSGLRVGSLDAVAVGRWSGSLASRSGYQQRGAFLQRLRDRLQGATEVSEMLQRITEKFASE